MGDTSHNSPKINGNSIQLIKF